MPPSLVGRGAPRALSKRLLESELGNAWEPGRGSNAEAEREQASRAAQDEYDKKLAAAQDTRKRNQEAREAEREPCLCTAAGAATLMRESHQLTRDALNKLEAAGSLMEWLRKNTKVQQSQ